jgi:hypothetical protein
MLASGFAIPVDGPCPFDRRWWYGLIRSEVADDLVDPTTRKLPSLRHDLRRHVRLIH